LGELDWANLHWAKDRSAKNIDHQKKRALNESKTCKAYYKNYKKNLGHGVQKLKTMQDNTSS